MVIDFRALRCIRLLELSYKDTRCTLVMETGL